MQTVNPLLGPAEGKPQLEVEVEGPAFENNHFMWERMDERARLLDEGVEALEHFEEAYTTEHWLVRIYRVKREDNRS